MSIRSKLTFAISAIVSLILVLNVVFSHMNAVRTQNNYIIQQITNVSKQLSFSVDVIAQTNNMLEIELAKRLHVSAQTAEQLLPNDIANISTEQLIKVKDQLNLSDLSLWVQDSEGLRLALSSNPNDVNLRSKNWKTWDAPMNEVMQLQPVSEATGYIEDHFYSGAINISVTDFKTAKKWGYYYTGKTNYMINPAINVDTTFKDGYLNSKETIVHQLINENPLFLEITAFKPYKIDLDYEAQLKTGKQDLNLEKRNIILGTYEYRNVDHDLTLIKQAFELNHIQYSDFTRYGKHLSRVFIPVHADNSYIFSIVIDKGLLQSSTTKQMHDHIVISIFLLLFTLIASYYFAYLLVKPLTKVMQKVNSISRNEFHAPLVHKSRDELGLLADRVNTMGSNLFRYTQQLKQTNVELLNTKQYLESLFNNTKDAIHIMDLNSKIIRVNQAFMKMFDYEQAGSEIIGQYLYNDDQLKEEYIILLQKVLNNNGLSSYETIMYTKNGAPINVSITISVIYDENQQPVAFASITRNITQRIKNEELLRTNEKLTAAGQLSASIAHEIRNPLTTIKGFLSLNKDNQHIPKKHMDLVIQEIEHVDIIVSQFLSMAKPDREHIDTINLYALINDIIMLMETSGKLYGISIKLNTQPDIASIKGSEQQLKQLFVNLINNSLEAMLDGGQLYITLSTETNEQQQPTSIMVSVLDNGVGMSEDELSQICEPFYTNKKNGSGLGLLVCQQIIASHKGALSFKSKQGSGTEAIVKLPIM